MNEILKYNLVNENNSQTSRHNFDKEELKIEILFNFKKELIIIGRFSRISICWLSKTSVDDKEINNKIFDYLLYGDRPKFISTEERVLGDSIGSIWYREKNNILKSDDIIITPFGHNYGCKDRNRHGMWFASDVKIFFDRMVERCKYRSCNGKYIDILKAYYSIMNGDKSPYYYEKVTELIEIIKSERYLVLSKDEKLRKVYIDCLEMTINLYNRYMTQVR